MVEKAVPEIVGGKRGARIAEGDLSEVFGIELAKGPKKPSIQPPAATGTAAVALRRKFAMSRSQFARLFGVSASTIAIWEKKKGALALQTRALRSWMEVSGLDKAGAWKRLRG